MLEMLEPADGSSDLKSTINALPPIDAHRKTRQPGEMTVFGESNENNRHSDDEDKVEDKNKSPGEYW